MIQDEQRRLYIGISSDPEQRLIDHNNSKGAAFTSKGLFRLVFKEGHSSLKEARGREVQLKKWRREKKEMLIERYKKGLTTKTTLK